MFITVTRILDIYTMPKIGKISHEIMLNLDNVLYIQERADSSGTAIEFANGLTIIVKESQWEIANQCRVQSCKGVK